MVCIQNTTLKKKKKKKKKKKPFCRSACSTLAVRPDVGGLFDAISASLEDVRSFVRSSVRSFPVFVSVSLLLLGIFLYTRWRSYKGVKEGVYHVSAHHDGWEDIRENVLNYDEEGGGEEDQNAYDMAELQKSLQPSPAQSLQYCRMRALHHPVLPGSQTQQQQQQQQHHHQYHHQYHHLLHQQHHHHPPQAPPAAPSTPADTLSRANSCTTLPPSVASSSTCANNPGSGSGSSSSGAVAVRRDVAPTRLPAQGQARPLTLARRSLSFSSQDLARYLCEIIRDADQHPDAGPFDSLQVFSTEGGGSPAGSLSSFSSAGLEGGAGGSDGGSSVAAAAGGGGGGGGSGGGEGKREETLGDWGPCFEKLRALYERPETSDL
ncbi:hypothetical protein CRUP_005343 [Coryphaenoides rupestris]|nr:hypothetical protein CRUP_005343 [Coryphaenoides rupestris]